MRPLGPRVLHVSAAVVFQVKPCSLWVSYQELCLLLRNPGPRLLKGTHMQALELGPSQCCRLRALRGLSRVKRDSVLRGALQAIWVCP